MNLQRLFISALATLAAFAATNAQSIDEARTLAEDGDMQAAIAMLTTLEQEQPKNAEIPQLLGDYYLATGADASARQAYEASRRKGNRNGTLALANMAANEYRLDEARQLLAAYRASLHKGKKQIAEDESDNLEERIDRIDNMLTRVEKIEIIDSIVVPADDFFRYYRLSPESGSLNSPSILPKGFEAADPTVVFEPESGRRMIWSAPDNNGLFTLFSSDALYGDEWEKPVMLGENLGEGGDANYPFLMPDGITLYFANDGENSLGGLDIFISRRNDAQGFLQPQNLGMPYNSPYDDYMLAIDEITGVGWWATDRNRIPGKVTIYVFIPQELRINVDPDDPDLADRARISSIRDTWTDTARRNNLIRSIMAIAPGGQVQQPDFTLAIPGRGVITRYEQLHTPRGKKAMAEYLNSVAKVDEAETNLQQLRAAYAKGDRSNVDKILQLESQLISARRDLIELRNEVISLEQ